MVFEVYKGKLENYHSDFYYRQDSSFRNIHDLEQKTVANTAANTSFN